MVEEEWLERNGWRGMVGEEWLKRNGWGGMAIYIYRMAELGVGGAIAGWDQFLELVNIANFSYYCFRITLNTFHFQKWYFSHLYLFFCVCICAILFFNIVFVYAVTIRILKLQ